MDYDVRPRGSHPNDTVQQAGTLRHVTLWRKSQAWLEPLGMARLMLTPTTFPISHK